ncbi:unnamed protein product [Rotaria magnacalcarata]|uniref:Uncharacterized protein n=1 Tax=Rotaria magnacalcarata TaxID=392030 RepID=A0A814TFK9_9BILA|nr:unnamed protein product [Rotaria magnacalcarata]
MLLPRLSNSYTPQNLMEFDDSTDKKIFRLDENDLANTKAVAIEFVTWTILKFMLMFISANGACLAYLKNEENVKEILLKLITYLQHDQLKIEFTQNQGLELLMEIAMKKPNWEKLIGVIETDSDNPLDIIPFVKQL